MRTQGEADVLGVCVYVENAGSESFTDFVRRRGIRRRAVYPAADVEGIHRGLKVGHEVHLEPVGEHGFDPRVDQHAREQRAHGGAVALVRHRLRHPLGVRGALHDAAAALAPRPLAAAALVAAAQHHVQDGAAH